MIWRITPQALGHIGEVLELALIVAGFAFVWRYWSTTIILWFTDREAYRARRRKERADWDDRDGW